MFVQNALPTESHLNWYSRLNSDFFVVSQHGFPSFIFACMWGDVLYKDKQHKR